MKKPDPAFEKKILLDVVDQMKNPEETIHKQTRLRKAIYIIGTLGLLAAFFLAINNVASTLSITFVAGMAGIAIGFGLFLEFAEKQWLVTKNHIDMNSIRARLDELDIRHDADTKF